MGAFFEVKMRTNETRQLRKITKFLENQKPILIGFYITGSMKTFETKKEALDYAKAKKWKVTNPFKL